MTSKQSADPGSRQETGGTTSGVATGQLIARIESLDLEGKGVARDGGKVMFIEGAITGELVHWKRLRSKARFDSGELVEVIESSNMRVSPPCRHFGLERGSCGGCTMQHIESRAQVSVKQRMLEECLARIGHVKPEMILRPIAGLTWQYRHRARLSVRDVPGKGGAMVGFRERASSYVADMLRCEVLARPVGTLLPALRQIVEKLSVRSRVPQIEVAIDKERTVLVFRVLEPVSEADRELLAVFAREHRVSVWLQSAGPDSAVPLDGDQAAELSLELPEFRISLPFRPTDFTQVNHRTNEILVRRALTLLDLGQGESVADFFCGMGNFTLPMARRAKSVVGLEGSAELLKRAQTAAGRLGLADRVGFRSRNLFEWTVDDWQELVDSAGGRIHKVLIDPPRDGALAVVKAFAVAQSPPARLVYVSCSPSTLARDCGLLVHEGGWRLRSAGVVNMFPHTSHVESMAVLEPST